MILYHRTTPETASAILGHGFRNSTGSYLTDRQFTGVWFSDQPLDIDGTREFSAVLCVLLDATQDELVEWEWVEEGKPYREWLIPAEVLNSSGVVSLCEED